MNFSLLIIATNYCSSTKLYIYAAMFHVIAYAISAINNNFNSLIDIILVQHILATSSQEGDIQACSTGVEVPTW